MPELPEVEFCATRLRAWLVGRRVERVEASPGRPLHALDADALAGARIAAVRRHGKQMFVDLDDGRVLLAHLGMTGKFLRDPPEARAGTRLQLWLDDGHRVDFVDPRRFGAVRLAAAGQVDSLPEVAGLGPDALALCAQPAAFVRRVGRTGREIKVALMDQSVLAGVGNIYAAEALHAARVDPFAPANAISPAALKRVAAELRAAMEASLARELADEIRYLPEADSDNPFTVYGREGEPCPRCGRAITRTLQQGRSTFWCMKCQRDRGLRRETRQR